MKKLAIALVCALTLVGCGSLGGGVSKEEAKKVALEFINANLMRPGTVAEIKEVSEEKGLYKIIVDAKMGQDITSYLTEDGKLFFPQALDIEQITKAKEAALKAGGEAPAAETPATPEAKTPEVKVETVPAGAPVEVKVEPAAEKKAEEPKKEEEKK